MQGSDDGSRKDQDADNSTPPAKPEPPQRPGPPPLKLGQGSSTFRFPPPKNPGGLTAPPGKGPPQLPPISVSGGVGPSNLKSDVTFALGESAILPAGPGAPPPLPVHDESTLHGLRRNPAPMRIPTLGGGPTPALESPPEELSPSAAAQLLRFDAELAMLEASEAEQPARLHLAAGRLLQAAGLHEAARQRFAAARTRNPRSVAAVAELRRLARAEGRWEDVLELLAVELEHATDAHRRADLYEEQARVLRYVAREDDALEALNNALQLRPDSLSALEAQRFLEQGRKNWSAVADLLGRAAELTTDPERSMAFRLVSAEIAEHRLNEPDIALDRYVQALTIVPTHLAALQGAERGLVRAQRWAELFEKLVAQAKAIDDTERTFALYVRAGIIAAERTHDRGAAVSCFEAAYQLKPDDVLPLLLLADLYRGQQHAWEELEATYGRLLQHAVDPTERLSITLARVDNLLTHVHPPDLAIEALIKLLNEQPTCRAALDRLRGLLIEQRRFREYIERAWMAATQMGSGHDQADAFVELGRFAEVRASSPERAAECYRRALSLRPNHAGAFQGLERLHRQAGHFDDLAKLYQATTEVCEDEARKASLLWDLAALYEARLDNVDGALHALEAYRALEPRDLSAIWMVQRLCGQKRDWNGLVDALEAELVLVTDPRRRADLCNRIAAVREEQGSLEPAITALRRAIAEESGYIPGHKALTRLLRDEQRWAELVAALEAYILVVVAEARAPLFHEIGVIYEQHLGERPNAVRFYEKTLASEPAYLPALTALERIHRTASDWKGLREVLERQLNTNLSPRRQAGALVRIGAMLDDRFGQPAESEAALRKALALEPQYTPASQHLALLLGTQGDWTKLTHLLDLAVSEEEHVGTRAQLAYALGSLLVWRVGALPDGVQPFELALALDPRLPGTRINLAYLLDVLGKPDESAVLLDEDANLSADPGVSVAALKEAADIATHKLKADPQRFLRRILELSPHDFTAIDRLSSRAESPAEMTELWRRRLQKPQGDEAVELRLALAESFGPEQAAAAQQLLQEAITLQPEHLPAVHMAADIAFAMQSFEAVCTLREREAELSRDPAGRVNAFVETATVARDRLGQFARARAAYSAALGISPNRDDIYDGLAELYRRESMWEPLTQALRQHIDALSPADRTRRLLELATAYRDQLDDNEQAVRTLRELLTIEPQHTGALDALAKLETVRQHWPEAAQAYREAIATGQGDLREFRLALATILSDHLAKAREAEKVLRELLAAQGPDPGALRLIGQLFFHQGRLEEAAQALGSLAQSSAPGQAAEIHVQLAQIAHARGLPNDAKEHLRIAATLIRKDIAALDPLLRWADKHGDHQTIANLLTDALVSAPSALDESLVPVRLALARLLKKLGNRADAEREARMAANSSPGDVEAQLVAAQLQIERAEARHFALRAIDVDPFAADAYRILAEGFAQARLGDAYGRVQQVLSLLCATDEHGEQQANELIAVQGRASAPLGAAGLLNYLAHKHLPEWGRELLMRAGPRAQIFVLHELPTQPCPDGHRVQGEAQNLAAIFGVTDFELMLTGAQGVSVAYDGERPQRLILGPVALNGSEAEMRYHVGYGLTPMLLGMTLLELLDDRDFLRLLQGLIGLAHDGYGDPDVVRQLARFLPRRNRKAVIEYAKAFDPSSLRIDLSMWRRALALTARRSGLLAARDVRAAASGLVRATSVTPPSPDPAQRLTAFRAIPDAGDLLRFAVSDEYAKIRRQLAFNRDPVARDGA